VSETTAALPMRATYTPTVPTVLVTGAAGLVGSHVARLLCERGDEVRVLVRDRTRDDNLRDLDVRPVRGDVLDRRALGRAMRGVEHVFHVAGATSMRMGRRELFAINAQGTRNVMAAARRAGVGRVVHTSSVAAIGPARRGMTADEAQPFSGGGLDVPYVHAKREAEMEALRAGAAGLDVVVVCPAHVFGRGDVYRSSTDIVRRFLRREIPAYVDGALNVVDVEDVAHGHLLAFERGRSGERYVLGNRNFTLDRLFADLGRLSGVEPPALKLPMPAAIALAAAAERMPGRPVITRTEVLAAGQWWAYRSTKARRELGWRPSHHEDTLETTIAWYRDREGERLRRSGARQPLGLRVTGWSMRRAGDLAGALRT
jgi:dihydroflavonol-4-reductase